MTPIPATDIRYNTHVFTQLAIHIQKHNCQDHLQCPLSVGVLLFWISRAHQPALCLQASGRFELQQLVNRRLLYRELFFRFNELRLKPIILSSKLKHERLLSLEISGAD